MSCGSSCGKPSCSCYTINAPQYNSCSRPTCCNGVINFNSCGGCNSCGNPCAVCPPGGPTGTGGTGTWCVPNFSPCSCGSPCGGSCGNSWGGNSWNSSSSSGSCKCGKYKKCGRCRSSCKCCCKCPPSLQPSLCSKCGILQATLGVTGSPATFSGTGTVINFSYTITNTGNQLINKQISIQDTRFGTWCLPVTCIFPGSSFTTIRQYTTVAADVTTGALYTYAIAFIQAKRKCWVYTNYSGVVTT